MSIATALQNARDKITSAYTAVSTKGGTVPSTQNLSNLPTAISSIPSGGGTPDYYKKFTVDNDGNLILDTSQTTCSFPNNVTKINATAAFSHAFENSPITTVDTNNVTDISGKAACQYMFQDSYVTTVDMSSLTIITGYSACTYMFSGCTRLRTVDLSGLQSVYNSATSCFKYMFDGCTNLTSVDLSGLQSIYAKNGFAYMFSGCKGLTSIDLSGLETIARDSTTGSATFYYCFRNCTSLTTVTIGGTTPINFYYSGTHVFDNMFSGCTQNITLNIATDQATLSQFAGYDSSGDGHHFGATGVVTINYTAVTE